tara:strand:+ start:233 stop:619 length:387 start_codon:yes stop_codon:yes gene_type:complete
MQIKRNINVKLSMETNTINVDQIWMTGRKGICSEYVLYQKVNTKYIQPIYETIKDLSKNLRNKKHFSKLAYDNKHRIYGMLDYIDTMGKEDLNELLEKDYSKVEFLLKIHEIRRRNVDRAINRQGHRP